jgi:predicted amidohydrolase YtcJ
MTAPDLILPGGAGVTLDRGSRVAEVIAMRGGRIDAVGPSPARLREADPDPRRIDWDTADPEGGPSGAVGHD